MLHRVSVGKKVESRKAPAAAVMQVDYDWSKVDPSINRVELPNGDGSWTIVYRDQAAMDADGPTRVERPPLDLDQLYRDCQRTQELRQLLADRAALDSKILKLGVTPEQLGGVTVTLNFHRDERGNLLSGELEFVSSASFLGATNEQIAAVLFPRDCKDDKRLKKALGRIRQMKTRLRKLNVVVG